MSSAVWGLIGVVLGALITAGSEWFIEGIRDRRLTIATANNSLSG
jgi:hypothetical protein